MTDGPNLTVDKDNNLIVDARELHRFLQVKTPFRKWFPRMCEYGFVKGVDYTPDIFVHPLNNQNTEDDLIKIDMAKEICMLQRTERGREMKRILCTAAEKFQ